MPRQAEAAQVAELAGRLAGVTRQTAACIVHEWLLNVRQEADVADISAAYRLMDLLDCHTCVQHVAQVYIKGIMGDSSPIFGMQDVLTEREAEQIAVRAADPRLRDARGAQTTATIPTLETSSEGGPKRVSVENLERLSPLRIIDVREPEEFAEGHVPGAVNIPLAQCLRAPEALAERTDERLCFICTKGIKSRLAAAAAIQAGYEEVVYAGMDPLS